MTTAEHPPRRNPSPGPSGRGFPASAPAAETVRVLNLKLLLITVGVVVVVIPAGYFWHDFQVKRTSLAYLERADTLEKEENWGLAADYLHRYLRVYPDDIDVRIRLAQTFDRVEGDYRHRAQSATLYSRAVGLAPEREDLRRRLAELQLETGNFAIAAEQAGKLLEAAPNDPVALRVRALSAYASAQTGDRNAMTMREVVRTFERALEADPANVQLSTALAHIYRNNMNELEPAERNALANRVIDDMVKVNPDSAEAHLARYAYRLQYELGSLQADIDRAVKLAPNDLTVILAAGENSLRNGVEAAKDKRANDRSRHLRDAEGHFRRAIELAPKDERGYLGLGQAQLAQDKAGLAVEAWVEGMKAAGQDSVELNHRLASVYIAMRSFDKAKVRLDALEKLVDKLSPQWQQLMRNVAAARIKFLRAKWHAGQGNHRETIGLLQDVVAAQHALGGVSKRGEDELFEAQMMLGAAYNALGQWDLAAAAFDHAVRLRSSSTQARVGAAQAWSNAGQTTAASEHFDQLVGAEGATAGVWLASVETRLRRQLALPEAQRNWVTLEEQFDQPPVEIRDSWQLKLLKADYLLARNGLTAVDQVIPLFAEAEQLHPRDGQLLHKLATSYERLGRPEDADRILKQLSLVVGKNGGFSLVAAELLAMRGERDRAIELLRSRLKTLPENEVPMVRYGLVQLYLQAGNLPEARAELLKLHEAQPSNAAVVRESAELALELRDFEDVERWEAKLQELEGRESTHWRYYRARRLLADTEDKRDPRFVEAVDLQKEIVNSRPSWAAGYLLWGLVAQRQGKWDEAITAYQKALDLGEARLGVYEQLIELLYQTQRFAEAEKLLARLRENTAISDRLSTVEISLAYQKGEKSRAIDLARDAVTRQPNDPMAKIRLGHTLLLNEQADEAEKVFQAAMKMAPNDIQVWNGLLSFYLRTDRKADAAKMLENFPKSANIPAAQRSFILAQGYELIGETDQARQHYQDAQQQAPRDVAVHLRMAEFQMKSDAEAAEKTLRHVLTIDPSQGQARRNLASILVARGGEIEWQEAQQLLESSPDDPDAGSGDLRLQASLLARRGGVQNRTKARQILEQLVLNPHAVTPGDRLLLARLYEAEGKFRSSRDEYLALVGKSDPQPAHLALFVDMLIRNNETTEAKRWLEELTRKAPEDLNTITLQAQLLKAQARSSEISELVEAYARKQVEKLTTNDERAQMCLQIGNLYSSVELHAQAQAWFERLNRFNPKAYQPLAKCLAAQDRLPAAIELCKEKAKGDNTPQAAVILAAVLTSGNPTQDDYALAEPLFREALKKYPESIDLLFSVAYIRTVQERSEDAVALYQQIKKVSPRHVPTLNNLAAVLSEMRGRQKEALAYIDEALDIAGAQPALLDTKAMVVLESNPRQAVELLLEATAVPDADPRYYLHLAMAYQKVGDLGKANKSLQQARANDLQKQPLTRTDEKLLLDLEKALRGNS